MRIVFLSLSVFARPARFFLGSLSVNNLIFSLIKVEHSVEFIEPRRLGLQLILLGKRLLNLKLCIFELDLRVFELRFTGRQFFLEAVQGIVQSLDIAENVGAQRYRMPQLTLLLLSRSCRGRRCFLRKDCTPLLLPKREFQTRTRGCFLLLKNGAM